MNQDSAAPILSPAQAGSGAEERPRGRSHRPRRGSGRRRGAGEGATAEPQGDAEAHPPAATQQFVTRVLTVPLVHPDKAQRKLLFDAARECARYGNHRMTERYMRAAKIATPEQTAFVRYRDKLSSVARLGVDSQVESSWRRSGRKTLAGVERVAAFDAYRALSLQVHQGGGRLDRDPDGFMLRVKILPGRGPLEELAVYMPAIERDRWAAGTLARIASGEWPVKRISFRFYRGRRLVKAMLAYQCPRITVEPGSQTARLALERDDTRLVLTCRGRELHLTDHMHRLRTMKAHFAGIHDRIRSSLGKARRYHDNRRALLRAGSFEEWATTPLHELSRRIVDWAQGQDAGLLMFAVGDAHGLPWARLEEMCRDKGAEMGIEVERERRGDGEDEGTQSRGDLGGSGASSKRCSRKRGKTQAGSGVSSEGVAADERAERK